MLGLQLDSVVSKSVCFTFLLGLALVIPSDVHASRKVPRCKDLKTATTAVNRATTALSKAQAKLETEKAWMNASSGFCSAPTAECKTTQNPKSPIWEGDLCMHYTETFFTCEKDYTSFSTQGVTVTYRGKPGSQWQINYKSAGSFPPCPAR